MSFTGASTLNGKVIVDVTSKGASVYLYMMPNKFSKEASNTIGIVENNQIKAKVESGSYEVPTDWTVYIAYNVGYLDGNIEIKSWAEEYTAIDKTKIDGDWQPTGTYFITQEELDQIAAEQAAMEEEARLELEEQQRIQAEILAQQELERQAASDAEAAREAQEAIRKLEEQQKAIEEKKA